MGEYLICNHCGLNINLEIDIHRNENGDIICNNCNNVINNS